MQFKLLFLLAKESTEVETGALVIIWQGIINKMHVNSIITVMMTMISCFHSL